MYVRLLKNQLDVFGVELAQVAETTIPRQALPPREWPTALDWAETMSVALAPGQYFIAFTDYAGRARVIPFIIEPPNPSTRVGLLSD